MDELLIFFLIILTIFVFTNFLKKNKEVSVVVSPIDGRKYIVRKLDDSKEAANRLAKLNTKVIQLIESLDVTEKDGINNLKENYNPNALSETGEGSDYTSYSVNKGEKISMCVRNPDNTFSDENTMMFVFIHELAHIMTHEVGHTKLFWSNMKFLLEKSEKINIYTPIDYKKTPIMYCGMEINSTPYKFSK